MPIVDFQPGDVNFKAYAGDDIPFTLTFSYDTTGGTHEFLISDTPTGAAILTLLSGSGLTVTPGVSTTVAVVIPRTFTDDYTENKKLYFAHKLTLNGVKQTKISGTIGLVVGIPG